MSATDRADQVSNFLKGVMLLVAAAVLIYLGLGLRSNTCGFFGNSLFCDVGSWVVILGAIVLLPGTIYSVVSVYDFARSR